MAVPRTPDAQRNALNSVRSQVNLLQNTTRTAPNYTTGAVEMVWQQFQMLRGSYANFRMTLNLQQLDYGANELAELDAGLDILQEGFGYYQNDVAAGRPPRTAIRDLCQYLRQGSGTWLQQLNWLSNQLRVGW